MLKLLTLTNFMIDDIADSDSFFYLRSDKIFINVLHSLFMENSVDWKPASFIDEAIQIVKANPISSKMSYVERLSVLKRRFGL